MNTKELRIVLGLSQEAFARRVGVSVRTVVRWERGVKPSQMAMKQLKRVEKEG